MTSPQVPSVLVINSCPMERLGLVSVIRNSPDRLRLWQDRDGIDNLIGARDGLSASADDVPNVILIELELPNLGVLDFIEEQINHYHNSIKIGVFTSYPVSPWGVMCADAGARGFVSKRVNADEFLSGLASLACGNFVFPTALTDQLIARGMARDTSKSKDRLSPRELEIYTLAGQGRSAKQIAQILHLSPKTVDCYFAHIKKKLSFSGIDEMKRSAFLFILQQEGALLAKQRPIEI